VVSATVQRELKRLPRQCRDRYRKAFELLAEEGPSYRSLRTHRYARSRDSPQVWGSSASMRLRFYWDYVGEGAIEVLALGSH